MARQLEDWIAETRESIVARLDGAREAQRQTRFTLGMMALISMMMLILGTTPTCPMTSVGLLPAPRRELRRSTAPSPSKTSLHTRHSRIGPRRETPRSTSWAFVFP